MLQFGANRLMMSADVLTQDTSVTDRRTDRHRTTAYHAMSMCRAVKKILERGSTIGEDDLMMLLSTSVITTADINNNNNNNNNIIIIIIIIIF